MCSPLPYLHVLPAPHCKIYPNKKFLKRMFHIGHRHVYIGHKGERYKKKILKPVFHIGEAKGECRTFSAV